MVSGAFQLPADRRRRVGLSSIPRTRFTRQKLIAEIIEDRRHPLPCFVLFRGKIRPRSFFWGSGAPGRRRSQLQRDSWMITSVGEKPKAKRQASLKVGDL